MFDFSFVFVFNSWKRTDHTYTWHVVFHTLHDPVVFHTLHVLLPSPYSSKQYHIYYNMIRVPLLSSQFTIIATITGNIFSCYHDRNWTLILLLCVNSTVIINQLWCNTIVYGIVNYVIVVTIGYSLSGTSPITSFVSGSNHML